MVHLLRIRKSVFCKGLLIWIRAFLWAIRKMPVNHTLYTTTGGGRRGTRLVLALAETETCLLDVGIQSPSPWCFTLLLSYNCSIITDRSSVDPGTYICSTRRGTNQMGIGQKGRTHTCMHARRQAGRHKIYSWCLNNYRINSNIGTAKK